MYRRPVPPPPLPRRLAAEILEIVDRLELDQTYAVEFWNRYRDRRPLEAMVAHGWTALGADDLLSLTPTELEAADGFYEELRRFALWVTSTEAMPATLEVRLARAAARLGPVGRAAADVLGGPPDPQPVPPFVEAWRTLLR